MKTLTLPELKRFGRSPEFIEAASTLLVKMAKAELIREKVDAYTKPIFDRFAFTKTGPLSERCGKAGELITDPKYLYLCQDEEKCARYFAACDAEHLKQGFKMKPGECPALVAEYEQTKAEWTLIALAEPVLGIPLGATNGYPECRKKMLDLLLGMACHEDGRKVA